MLWVSQRRSSPADILCKDYIQRLVSMFPLRFVQVQNCPNHFGEKQICPRHMPKLAQIHKNLAEMQVKFCPNITLACLVLGPLVFLLYINDLPHTSNFDTMLSVDDTNLHLSHHNINILQSQVNQEINKINQWVIVIN